MKRTTQKDQGSQTKSDEEDKVFQVLEPDEQQGDTTGRIEEGPKFEEILKKLLLRSTSETRTQGKKRKGEV